MKKSASLCQPAEKRRLLLLACLAIATLSSACYHTNSYLLRIDAQRQSESELCEVGSDKTKRCQALSGQALDAPGVLALELTNTVAEQEYSVQLEETRLGSPSAPTPDEVVKEVATRLTGLSKDFVGQLDKGEPNAQQEAATKLLVSVSKGVASRQPAAAATLSGIAAGLKPRQAPARTAAEAKAIWLPWIDEAALSWKASLAPGDPRIAPPRAVEYASVDQAYLAEYLGQRTGQKDPKTGKRPDEKLSGPFLAKFTVAYCKPDSFGTDPSTGQPWVSEPAPWSNQADLLKKIALEPSQIEQLVKSGDRELELGKRIGQLLTEADGATPAKPAREPAHVLKYLLTVSRIVGDLRRCEHNLASFVGLPPAEAKEVAETLQSVQEARGRLQDTATAERVFEDMIAPFAVSAAVQTLTRRSTGGTLTFGNYTLHPGRLALVATSGNEEKPDVVTKQELLVRDVGPVSVSLGPFVSACPSCIHAVSERFEVQDAQGTPSVERSLQDDTKSASIGAAAMLHYTLLGGTTNQGGFALGYPLRDQTGTALGVLAGFSWRNTVGLQLATGVHVFETKKLKQGVTSGAASTESLENGTQPVPTAAWFFFIGATSDLLVKP